MVSVKDVVMVSSKCGDGVSQDVVKDVVRQCVVMVFVKGYAW